MIPEQHRKTVGWVSLCVACVGGAEGLRTVAYKDPVGIPTICFGETRGVHMGDRATVDQCKDLLVYRVQEFSDEIDKCVTVELPAERRAAVVSFAYNVGTAKFCKSTLARYLNAGRPAAACDEFMRWTRAAGVELPGLVKRRSEERELCRKGLE